MTPQEAASLVNLAGFTAGTVLYAMLLIMVLRPSGPWDAIRRVDGLLLATALLGLGWNLEAFINFGLRDF